MVLRERKDLKDDTKIFQLSRNPVQSFLRGFNSGIHAHLFRKRFQVVLEDAGIPLNWVDRLLGHVSRGAQGKTYSIPPTEKLREHYRKAMKELQIYGYKESPFNGELKDYLSKCFSKVLSKYLNQQITKREISKMLEDI